MPIGESFAKGIGIYSTLSGLRQRQQELKAAQDYRSRSLALQEKQLQIQQKQQQFANTLQLMKGYTQLYNSMELPEAKYQVLRKLLTLGNTADPQNPLPVPSYEQFSKTRGVVT